MKTAQCKYNHAGTEVAISLYFDTKAFEFISPALTESDQDDFIRLIGDSVAADMPKENSGRFLYIKRVTRDTNTNTLTLFCSDGYLIDQHFTLPISQQAFAKERIKITEIDQLPPRLKLTADFIKLINARLPAFEEEAHKHQPIAAAIPDREALKQEKIETPVQQYESDKATDVIAEIGNVKKEINEMAETGIKTLNQLLEQIDRTEKRIVTDVMKETQSGISQTDNKAKLEEYATLALAQFGGVNTTTSKAALNQKMAEIKPISSQFNAEIEDTTKRILQQTDRLFLFKKTLINALYDAAKEFSDTLLPQFTTATPNAKKTLVIDFNKKFTPIASLSNTGVLTSREAAEEKLSPLSFEDLQTIISNDAKDNPGLLQKCNTSWTEESPELRILIQHLSKLNGQLSSLFDNDTEFAAYAHQDMTEITRIPFPRSFQFKFTANALNYKQSVDDFCKTQKDIISNLANKYKKTIQLDEAQDKAKRAIAAIQQQIENLKIPVTQFRDLLKFKEASSDLITAAKKEQNLAKDLVKKAARAIAEAGSNENQNKNDNVPVKDLQAKIDEISLIIKTMNETKIEIDQIINAVNTQSSEKTNTTELEEKLERMEAQFKAVTDQSHVIQSLNQRLSGSDYIYDLDEQVNAILAQTDMRVQQGEAKACLLEFIKNENRDVTATDDLKKRMIEHYTQVDSNALAIDKLARELTTLKNQIFADLSDHSIPTNELETKAQTIKDKIQAIEAAKTVLQDNLSALKKLNAENK